MLTIKPQILFILIFFVLFSCNKGTGTYVRVEQNNVRLKCFPETFQGKVLSFYPFTNGSIRDFSTGNHNLSNTSNASSTSDRHGNTKVLSHLID